MAILLGTATAQITLDNSQFMAAAAQSAGAMDQLARAGTNAQPTFFDKLKTSALGLGTALIVPMGLGISAAIDLEQSIANVNAALGGIDSGILDELAAGFQELATTSQFSATEVAAVGEGLAKAGFDSDELINATEAVILLSQATGDGLAPAMDSVVAAMSIWSEETVGLENALTDATQVADIMTIAANNSTASITDINAGMRSLGPVAASMGVGFDEAAAAIALFTNYGLKGADAGISLARGLQNLANPSSEAAVLMDQLGIAAFDMQGNFIGFPALFDQLKVAMGDMTDQQQLMALSTIFGAEAMDVMGLAILNGADPLESLIALMDESGAAAEQSAIRMNTVGAKADTLLEGLTTLLGSFVEGLLPAGHIVLDFANTVVDALMKIPQPIKTVIGAIAGMLALFASINIGIGLFGALSGAMGALGIGATGAGLALAPLLGIVLAIGAAVGALYLAWKTNFLGMRKMFQSFTSGISRFGKSFADTFKNLTTATYQWGDTVDDIVPTMDTFPALFIALGNAIGTIGGGVPILGDLGRAIVDFGFDLDQLFSVFQQLRGEGFGPFIAGLTAITSAFPALIPLVNAATPAVQSLVDAFQAFTAGDFAGGIRLIGEAAASAFDAIVNFGGEIAGWVLDVAAPTITGWIVDVAGDVWGAITAAAGFAWTGLADLGAWTLDVAVPTITGWLLSFAGDAWTALKAAAGYAGSFIATIGAWVLDVATPTVTGWLEILAGNVWGGLANAAGYAGTLAATLDTWILNVAAPTAAGWITSAAAWIAEQIGLQDFTSAGTTTSEKVMAAISAAFSSGEAAGGAIGGGITGLGNLAQWIADGINALDFEAAGNAVGQKLTAAVAAVFAGGLSFETLKGAFFTGITNALGDVSWDSVGLQFWNLFEAVLTAPTDFATGLVEGVTSSITTAIGQIDWPAIASTIGTELSTAIGEVKGFATSLGTTLNNEVAQAVNVVNWGSVASSIGTNLSEAISGLSGFASSLGSTIGSEFSQALNNVDWGGIGGTIRDKLVGAVTGVGAAIWDAIWGEITGGADDADWNLQPDAQNPDDFIDPGTNDTGTTTGGRGFTMKRLIDPAAIAEADLLKSKLQELQLVAAGMVPAFDGISQAVSGAMSGAVSAAQDGINQIIVALANGGVTATNSLRNALAPIPGVVSAVGSTAALNALLAGIKIADNFGTGAGFADDRVRAALSGVAGAVRAAGATAALAALAAGINIGQAMAAGIRSQIGEVQAAAAALGAAATVGASKQLRISSPSKVFMQLGEYVGEGFALGIRSMIPATTLAAADLVHVPNVIPGQYAGAGASYGVVQTGGSGAVNVTVNVAGNVTAEEDLTVSIASAVSESMVRESHRRNVAIGVPS